MTITFYAIGLAIGVALSIAAGVLAGVQLERRLTVRRLWAMSDRRGKVANEALKAVKQLEDRPRTRGEDFDYQVAIQRQVANGAASKALSDEAAYLDVLAPTLLFWRYR